MSEGHASGPEMVCTDEWIGVAGAVVDAYLHHDFHRRGIVEDIMPDSSGLWIAAQSPYSREFIDKASGYIVDQTLDTAESCRWASVRSD